MSSKPPPELTNKPQQAKDNPLGASLLAAVLMNEGLRNLDNQQLTQARSLMKMADAAKGKMPKIKANSQIAKAIKALEKTAVAP